MTWKEQQLRPIKVQKLQEVVRGDLVAWLFLADALEVIKIKQRTEKIAFSERGRGHNCISLHVFQFVYILFFYLRFTGCSKKNRDVIFFNFFLFGINEIFNTCKCELFKMPLSLLLPHLLKITEYCHKMNIN